MHNIKGRDMLSPVIPLRAGIGEQNVYSIFLQIEILH